MVFRVGPGEKLGKVEVQCSRTQCFEPSDSHMSIRIVDSKSRSIVIDLHIPLAAFTELITGMVVTDVEARFGELENVGKVRTIETTTLDYNVSDEELQQVIAAYKERGFRCIVRQNNAAKKKVIAERYDAERVDDVADNLEGD